MFKLVKTKVRGNLVSRQKKTLLYNTLYTEKSRTTAYFSLKTANTKKKQSDNLKELGEKIYNPRIIYLKEIYFSKNGEEIKSFSKRQQVRISFQGKLHCWKMFFREKYNTTQKCGFTQINERLGKEIKIKIKFFIFLLLLSLKINIWTKIVAMYCVFIAYIRGKYLPTKVRRMKSRNWKCTKIFILHTKLYNAIWKWFLII